MSRNSQIQLAPFTYVVKILVFTTVGIWFIGQVLFSKIFGINLVQYFALTPEAVIERFEIWRLLTYIFLHTADQPSAVTHILFNMLMLWFFGARLELLWGRRFFITYYLLSGVGAAIIYCIGIFSYSLIKGEQISMMIPVIGASGSVFGLILAYGITFRHEVIYFMGLFPMRAITFAMLAAVMDFSSMVTASVTGGGVAYLAHLGGFASGFLLLRGRKYLKNYTDGRRMKKKYNNLRLVVDNERKGQVEKGPRYWN